MMCRDLLGRLMLPLVALLMGGCKVEYHPYETRVEGECNINATHIAEIEAACAGKREIRFAMISDTQRWYDETEDVVASLNSRSDIDFVIHGGDLTDFGIRNEYELQRDILNRLTVPYVVVVGNHDCLATGRELYRKIFGDYNFAFTAGTVHFVCVNTNSVEFAEQQPDLAFMDQQLHDFPAEADKTIVVMHASPTSEQFRPAMLDDFLARVRSYPNLQCCLYGHGHCFGDDEFFEDGIRYIQCGNIEKRGYYIFTVNESGYSYEQVDF